VPGDLPAEASGGYPALETRQEVHGLFQVGKGALASLAHLHIPQTTIVKETAELETK